MKAVFYLASLVATLSTVMVITCHRAVHALLYLIVSLLSVAMVFVVLGAPFVAALEVIIYAGAIVVLFIFVVMLIGAEDLDTARHWISPRMFIGPSILAAILLAELVYVLTSGSHAALPGVVVGPHDVGMALFGPYLIGVELAALLLLAGMMGAYHLGRREDGEEE